MGLSMRFFFFSWRHRHFIPWDVFIRPVCPGQDWNFVCKAVVCVLSVFSFSLPLYASVHTVCFLLLRGRYVLEDQGLPVVMCVHIFVYMSFFVCLYICLSKRFLLKFFQLYDRNVLLWNALCWRSTILETCLCQILSNSKCLPHFQFWHVANYSNGFNILLSTPVHVQLCEQQLWCKI